MRIGIDIGGSHVGIGLINENGTIIAKEEQELNNYSKEENYGEKLTSTIIELITKLLENNNIDINKISLIGLAIPGTVSDTRIIKADNLHIKDYDIVSEINKYFNIKVMLRNDAKCAAIAEKEYGSLKKADDAVFLTIGTGVGGAVFLGGRLLKPKKYEGFEIGHMVIEKDGIQCNCGRKGCFEKYASMKALKDMVQTELKKDEITGIELKEILSSPQNQEKTNVIIEKYVQNLALGIANLVNIFEPETISIGGSLVFFKDIFLDKLKSTLNDGKMLFNKHMPNIVMAKLKNDAGIIGSVIEYKV